MTTSSLTRYNKRASALKTTGSFSTEIGTLGNLIINQVTLIAKTPDSEGFDSFYEDHPADAVIFEVWKGNECKVFEADFEMKAWLEQFANFHNDTPNASIIL